MSNKKKQTKKDRFNSTFLKYMMMPEILLLSKSLTSITIFFFDVIGITISFVDEDRFIICS